jgi:hypothetical protein
MQTYGDDWCITGYPAVESSEDKSAAVALKEEK